MNGNKLRLEVIQQIAKSGKAYSNEIKDMAEEIIELRKKLNTPEPGEGYFWIPDPWKANSP